MVRRHSVSSAATLVRYVEWTPAEDPSRRRGRLVVQSERDVDFEKRQHARTALMGGGKLGIAPDPAAQRDVLPPDATPRSSPISGDGERTWGAEWTTSP